jgi:hypothetical protein|tara:strand:+ start:3003 stop:3212 length:210 start_codon:yes stop_codon:yes gene_type:complete
MIEFKVVTTPRQDRFEESVVALLNDGWMLHGSPFISQTGGMTQSLTRDKPVVSSPVERSKKIENKAVPK